MRDVMCVIVYDVRVGGDGVAVVYVVVVDACDAAVDVALVATVGVDSIVYRCAIVVGVGGCVVCDDCSVSVVWCWR